MIRSARWAVIVCAALLGLAACGEDAPGPATESSGSAVPATPSPSTSPGTNAPSQSTAPASPAPAATTAPAAEPTGVVVEVIALDNTFRPETVEIHVGDAVQWENRGANEHNVLSIEGEEWGVQVDDFQPGDVYTHVFTEPGEYAYYCSIHGNETIGMVGTVTVLP